MGILISLIAIVVLMLIGYAGGSVEALHPVFGIALPYIAIVVFIVGIIVRILKWARTPVPFNITTTCGQQKSLDFIHQNKIDNPYTGFQATLRMAFEILFFRSLFRNTKAELNDKQRLVYGDSKWLWAFSLAFHWSFLIVVLRHFRFFTEPVPGFVRYINSLDSFFQIGLPIITITGFVLVLAVGYLLFRRFFDQKVRYISLASDYFPLFLILSIGLTGIWMKYIDKVNLEGIKEMTVSIFRFNPVVPEAIEASFFIHLFLVCILLIYIPMSKLVHMPGIFFTPTRNMANNTRAKRHVNPWNEDFKMHHHTYEEYEDEFRDFMRGCDLPLEKEEKDGK